MLEQSKLNPKRMFNDGVMGMGPTDAKFTGVWVDPYTGYEYDAYEQEAAPPNGDWRVKDSGKQRMFEALHGGWAPGRARPKKREFAPQDISPDIDRTDWEGLARQRGMEIMKIEQLHSGHKDEYAHTDDEGYSKVIEGKPFNRWGLNDGNRSLPFPDLHLHRDTMATPQWGQAASTAAAVGGDGAYMRPSVMRSRVNNSSFDNDRRMAVSDVDNGFGNVQDTNLQESLRIDAFIRDMGEGMDTAGIVDTTGGAQWQHQEDPLQRMLSTREDLSTSLGQLFMRITSDHLQTGDHALPDDAIPGLRDSTFARKIGEFMIDTGMTAPSMRQEYSDMSPNHRDEMALALGDLIRSIDAQNHGPTSIRETQFDNIEKDAMSMALGRAIMNMTGLTESQGLSAPTTVRMQEREDPLRSSEFARRIGQ